MRLTRNLTILFCMVLACLPVACGKGKETGEPERGIYFWATRFDLDSTKQDFLKRHSVTRLYMRLFDVVPGKDGRAVPNGTIAFPDSMPDLKGMNLEVVPVVFILNKCMEDDDKELASLLVKRILQMCETRRLGKLKEIQIDCDWTQTTEKRYFAFLEEVRGELEKQSKTPVELSATIRLHQLSMPAPPVDKGVLMVYNTGDMRDLKKEKPILDFEDVAPYLKAIDSYPLPLAQAYPIYKWELVFRNGKFVDIMHGEDDMPVLKSDTVVSRVPTAEEILLCKRAIEKRREDCRKEIILFDLNNYNITRFPDEDFENFYR